MKTTQQTVYKSQVSDTLVIKKVFLNQEVNVVQLDVSSSDKTFNTFILHSPPLPLYLLANRILPSVRCMDLESTVHYSIVHSQ